MVSEPRGSCADVTRLQTHLPVFGLVDPLRIGPRKVALTVEGSDGSTELRHGVEVGGEIIQHGHNVGGKRCSLCPLFGNPVHLQGWRKEMETRARPQPLTNRKRPEIRSLQLSQVKSR